HLYLHQQHALLFTFSFSLFPNAKKQGSRINTSTRLPDTPYSDITSTLSELQKRNSVLKEEARALRFKALLAEARAATDETGEDQPQQSVSPKGHRGRRGQGHTLEQRMEFVEVFRHFSKKTDMKVTPHSFGKFVNTPIKRQLITQWNKDFDKIKFDVAHGRGGERTLSTTPDDLMRHILDKTVYGWLHEVRKSNGAVSGLQLQAAADSVLHILMDDIFAFDDIPTAAQFLLRHRGV
ncbi:hypothetical protein EDD11_010484, partial [Mortierella claussenii]